MTRRWGTAHARSSDRGHAAAKCDAWARRARRTAIMLCRSICLARMRRRVATDAWLRTAGTRACLGRIRRDVRVGILHRPLWWIDRIGGYACRRR